MPTLSEDCIALTDVHGAYYTMVRLLNAAPKGLKLVFGGDLVDRGPHSRKVVEFAMANAIPTVKGNHEDLLLAFYNRDAKCASHYKRGVWLSNGGDKAVKNWPVIDSRGKSEAVRNRDRGIGGCVPDNVLEWMEGLPPYLTPSDQTDENGRKWLLSHTGYGLNADSGHWFSTLWGRWYEDGPFARDPETGEERDDGWFRSFGHSVVKKPILTETYCAHDTGAVYGSRGGGTLSAFIWPSKRILTQPFDETPIAPTFTIVDGRLA